MRKIALFIILLTCSVFSQAGDLELTDLINKYYDIKKHDIVCESAYNYAPLALMKRHLNRQTLGEMMQEIQKQDSPKEIQMIEMEVLIRAPHPGTFKSTQEVKVAALRFQYEQFIECRKKLL